MAPFWANRSCDAFSAKEEPCVKGSYTQYAVRVESTADVVKTIAFAKEQNLRLVVRNTGHDYLGKSTGAGGLGLWMHHMQGVSILDYQSNYYNGKAAKVAAGMLSVDVSAEAHRRGYSVVGGNCPTVGLAGGYTQGGGVGPLTSRYGFGADQVLEWEVVTLDGKILRATPDSNNDLYWALSGGGGGTFGVVVSVVVKAYPKERTASANLTFGSANVPPDAFYEAVEVFHGVVPTLSEAGGVAIYVIQSTAFALIPAMLPGSSKKQLDDILKPVLDKLQHLNITYGTRLMLNSHRSANPS
jgi:FAD/FMN-containing dehydrogenase